MLDVVTVAAPLLATLSIALICLGFTEIGNEKVFRFVLGEIALMTAVAYAFLAALSVSWFAPICSVFWFFTGSWNFAAAIWRATE